MTTAGDVQPFRDAWSSRPETQRYHFRVGPPRTQVEFAFQNHWRLFLGLLDSERAGPVLEVGAGRGSMGAFFAHAGHSTYLLDTSRAALDSARANFARDGLSGRFVLANALELPFEENSFDVVVSIGLMEHFTSIEQACAEQLRVLAPGGMLLNYVVPERCLSVQTLAMPLNCALAAAFRLGVRQERRQGQNKPKLFRNRLTGADYRRVYGKLGFRECGTYGTFPVPLVSHSAGFPFSALPCWAERNVIRLWRLLLRAYGSLARHDPWQCPERWGLAFVAWARK